MKVDMDHPLYQNFVHPEICYLLHHGGFTKKTIYKWVACNGNVALDTRVFDMDSYYKDAEELILSVAPPDWIVPAFTLKEVEEELPEYFLHVHQSVYTLTLKEYYNIAAKNIRMPDVFANVLWMCLSAKIKKQAACE